MTTVITTALITIILSLGLGASAETSTYIDGQTLNMELVCDHVLLEVITYEMAQDMLDAQTIASGSLEIQVAEICGN